MRDRGLGVVVVRRDWRSATPIPLLSGVDDRDVQQRKHMAQGLDLFAEHLVEIAGVAVALDAPQAGALDGLDDRGLAEADEECRPRLDGDAVPCARAIGGQAFSVLCGVIGIGVGVEV